MHLHLEPFLSMLGATVVVVSSTAPVVIAVICGGGGGSGMSGGGGHVMGLCWPVLAIVALLGCLGCHVVSSGKMEIKMHKNIPDAPAAVAVFVHSPQAIVGLNWLSWVSGGHW